MLHQQMGKRAKGASQPICTASFEPLANALADRRRQLRSEWLQENTTPCSLRPSPGVELEFDLDFTSVKLRRIATYIKHPAASLFSRHQSTSLSCVQDSAINFCLWLINKDDNGDSTFLSTMGSHQISVARNRLGDLWEYRQQEQRTGTFVALEGYQPSFLKWAANYLEERPEDILARGESLAKP